MNEDSEDKEILGAALKPNVVERESEDSEIDDEGNRFIDISNELMEDVILKNIEEQFESPDENPINYVTEYIRSYDRIVGDNEYPVDKKLISNSVEKLGRAVLGGLETYFGVTLTDVAGSETYDGNDREFLSKLETLYEFFICRRMENIEQYFKSKINANRESLVIQYKACLQNKDRDDVIYQANRKKYGNTKFSIFIHFVTEFINDSKANITDGLEFFSSIISLDEFEETNENMKELIDNYGTDMTFTVPTEKVAGRYLAILKDDACFMRLRNFIMEAFTESEKPEATDGKLFVSADK